MNDLTDRDLELIEVALEAAVNACGTPFAPGDGTANLAGEYKTALLHVRQKPSAHHVTPKLTQREAKELTTLLNMVLTNSDQWESMDLRALARAANKIEG